MAPMANAVTVSLEDLKNGTVSSETLVKAFGPTSLGILIVKDLPEAFVPMRRHLLSYSSYLGNLPKTELAKLENEKAKYLTGWSLGKETLKNGQADTLKGSYYANCAFYVDPALTSAKATPEFPEDSFPEYLSPNIWPDETTLPGFQTAFEDLCRLVIDTAVLVAKACDRYAVSEVEGYPAGYLEKMVGSSTTTKARLLHYYPEQVWQGATKTVGEGAPGSLGATGASTTDTTPDDDTWCATHLDHGCLTGLTSAMLVDELEPSTSALLTGPSFTDSVPPTLAPLEELKDPPEEVKSAGLYIRSRTGETVQVKIPRDCLAFQTGEALERITGGNFRAVPHFVKGPKAVGEGRRIARNTLAVFTQPELGDEVDRTEHLTFGAFAREIVARNTAGETGFS